MFFFYWRKSMDDYVTKAVHEEFSKRIEEENTRQNHRIANLELAMNQLSELISSVKVLAVNVENIAEQIKTQGERLKEIENVPKKRYESIVACIVTGLVSAALAYFLTR